MLETSLGTQGLLKYCSYYLHNKCLRWACTIRDKSTRYCSPLITYNYSRNRGTCCKQRTHDFVQDKNTGAISRFCSSWKNGSKLTMLCKVQGKQLRLVYVWGVPLDYFIITPFWIKWTQNFSLITIFLIILICAVTLVKIRRKMVI